MSLKGPSHIQNGARTTSLRAKKRIFARMTARVCSITAGSAAIFRDRPAFAGHRNLFLMQRFSNGRISDLRNMTCTNFRCPIYARSGRRVEPARASPGCRAGVDRFNNYRPKLGRRPPVYRPGFARLPLDYRRAPGDFWSLVFEGQRPSPVQNVTGYISSKKIRSIPWRIWNSATFERSTISAGDRWICDLGIMLPFHCQTLRLFCTLYCPNILFSYAPRALYRVDLALYKSYELWLLLLSLLFFHFVSFLLPLFSLKIRLKTQKKRVKSAELRYGYLHFILEWARGTLDL